MRNRKSQRHLDTTILGTFRLTKRELVNIEKIIEKHIERTPASSHYIELGDTRNWLGFFRARTEEYASARYISLKAARTYHYARIVFRAPSLSVEFMPRRTEINVQRANYKDEQLRQVDSAKREVIKYLNTLNQARGASMWWNRNRLCFC